RREHLVTLLWDIPDDPRGALRTTLSKLRTVMNEPGRHRIVAERDSIRLDASDVDVDLTAAGRLTTARPDSSSLRDLEAVVASFRGEFAEGLTLRNCPIFYSWCLAEREGARRLHARLLRALIECHQTAPEAALPHARALARISPEEVFAHATLLRVLVAS